MALQQNLAAVKSVHLAGYPEWIILGTGGPQFATGLGLSYSACHNVAGTKTKNATGSHRVPAYIAMQVAVATDYACTARGEACTLGEKRSVGQGNLLAQVECRTVEHVQIHGPTVSHLKAVGAAQASKQPHIGSQNADCPVIDHLVIYL